MQWATLQHACGPTASLAHLPTHFPAYLPSLRATPATALPLADARSAKPLHALGGSRSGTWLQARTPARATRVQMAENPLDQILRDAVGGGSAPPNQRGARVVNLPKSRPSANDEDAPPASRAARAAVLASALLAPFAVVTLVTNLAKVDVTAGRKSDNQPFDEGDAVTAPYLETALIGMTSDGAITPKEGARYATVSQIVSQLEAQGGPQLFASKAPGKWCIPWVGGWDRIWVTDPEKRMPGAPFSTTQSLTVEKGSPSLQRGSSVFSLTSSRMFIYGPGAGGMAIEYLHASPDAQGELLLTQLADIKNLGGNFFEVNYPAELMAFTAVKEKSGERVLASPSPLPGKMSFGPRAESATLQTTYLSPTMWILRDEDGRKAVFTRSETKSVADRRGLVVEGQVKEHPDEQTRYGKLLFSESLSDYAGWEQNVEGSKASENIENALRK